MYEIKILPNIRHLFCKHTLRSSLECEISTAVERFHEKNNNVKPTCHKIYQGRYYLLIFFLNIYVLLQSSRCRSNALCLLAQRSVSSANGHFVLAISFFKISNPCARLDGWKTLKLHQFHQIMLVLFEICTQKLIIRIESWFWSFNGGMNGIAQCAFRLIHSYLH